MPNRDNEQAHPGNSGIGASPFAEQATVQPVANMLAETPASLACVYGLVAKTTGFPPLTLTTNATGGSLAIAIVDAYESSTALTD